MDRIIPISELQTSAKRFVDQVKNTDEAVIVTQRGRASAVLVSYETYQGLAATQDELSFPDWRRRLKRAQRESGRGILLETYLRKRARRS